MRTVQFVEIDPYCRAVLAKHWPSVPCHGDIRTFSQAVGFSDVICAGFPCQDISYAGRGEGIDGARSGLWSEVARIVSAVRPRYVIVENVAALLRRGIGRVLGDLAHIGYDAQWDCFGSSALGSPHDRKRVWLVAYPQGVRQGQLRWIGRSEEGAEIGCVHWPANEPPSQRVVDGVAHRVERLTALGNSLLPQIPEMIGRAIMSQQGSAGCSNG
jgi:DNA (cytosine-5)-methyltransferase 1